MSTDVEAEGAMWIAYTRAVSPRLAECELTHLPREPIDLEVARAQHATYERALRDLGCEVRRLPDAPDHPDSVFVEDVAVVVDEVAVVTRPGALSRRGEVTGVAEALARHRTVRHIEAPGRVDGGDVLVVGNLVFVGASERTDLEGARQLQETLEPFGYQVRRVPVRGCLHLKSAVSVAADDMVVLNPDWVDRRTFRDLRVVEVAAGEPVAANVLRVGDAVLLAAGHPRTADRIAAAGVSRQVSVDVSELEKAEAGVTCCSLVFRAEAEA